MRYVPRAEPGSFPAGLLAVLVHVALFAFLFLTVRWQIRPPSPVTAELWSQVPVAQVPQPPAPKPPPVVERKPDPPPPPPVAKAPPPPPPPVEKPAPQKPDIAIELEKKAKEAKVREDREKKERLDKERLEQEKKDRIEKEKKERDRAEKQRIEQELKKELARDSERAMQEQIARESESLRKEREMRDLAAKAAAAADNRARAQWLDRIRAKIRGNVINPDGMSGNPQAVFVVVLLPTGEVVDRRLVQSSGNRAYDEAVERGILKSSPLPIPDKPEVFVRELRLTFRPFE